MKNDGKKLRSRDYLDVLMVSGRYAFTSSEAKEALKASPAAAKMALARLAKQGLIASPARGFYVIVPPEYRSLGCLPADQFIPALMAHRHQSYYVAVLSAAQYHGAAHHRPQEFQVMLERPRRPIVCGKVRVNFFVKSDLESTPTQEFNTPRGKIIASTPEATALDLVGYQENAGGLDNVATIISELATKLEPKKLALAAKHFPMPWAQRLGYLLSSLGHQSKANQLKELVKNESPQFVSLLPGMLGSDIGKDQNWRLNVNTTIEAEA
jgi:predicted transcriptional regulator of viral defense system